jgi:CheY-like chemotaxis protein
MAKGTILFIDDNISFLHSRKEFLEKEGYRVLTATDLQQARDILGSEHVDLVIIDIRLERPNDEKDLSGILLAKEIASSVPKIMLTDYPSVKYVIESLRPTQGFAPAIDFIAKEDGGDALLRAVSTALLRNVFIAHGHDKPTTGMIARFIEKIGLRAIILEEQPHAGHTVIEMFENYASTTAFAVVLLTPDYIGVSQALPQNIRPRARQNVIFELGYFVNKLGRSRVAVLYKGEVEIPSQYAGVLCIPLDDPRYD